jgi:cytochrome c peroxidase
MRKTLKAIRVLPMAGFALALATQAAPAQDAAANVVKSGDYTLELPRGLKADGAYIPENNPLSVAKVDLGKLLYFDPRLSKDNTVSCASCHNPYHGFADPAPTSKGVGGSLGGRNSPTVINRLFSKEQFWDGRAADLEDQAKGPITNPVEMAMASHDFAVKNVRSIRGYEPLFVAAFGSTTVDIDRIAKAIASYERTVVAGDSPWDRYLAGQTDAMSGAAVRGMGLFLGKGRCITCHVGQNFTDEKYHNLGVGMDGDKPDLGRYEISKQESDKGAFKTPGLRNIADQSPYMHDGSERTLRQVMELYNRGGVKNQWLSPLIQPLNLGEQEIDDLVAFMHALTGTVTNAEPPASLPR